MRRLDQESERATMTLTEDIRAIVERVKNLGPEWRHTANVLTDALGAAEHAQNARLRYLTTCIDEAKGRLAYHKQEIRTLPEQIAKLEAERAHLESQTGLDPLRAVVMGRAPAAVEVAPSDPFVPGLPPLRLRKVWAEWEDIAGDILRFTQDGQKFGWIRVGSAQFLLADVLWEPVTELDSNERYRPHGATWARVEAMADEAEKPTLLDLTKLPPGTVCEAVGEILTYLGRRIKPGEVFRIVEPDDGMGDKHPTNIEIEFAGFSVPALVPARVVKEGGEQ